MPFLGKLLGTGAGDLIKKIGDVVGQFIPNKVQKVEALQKIQQVINTHEVQMAQEITKRQQNDMTSDSWLSKNIRPLTLIFIVGLFTILSVTDGNIGQFKVDPAYIDLLRSWGMMIMTFYFGSRGLEKISSIVTKNLMQTRKQRNQPDKNE